MNSSEKMLDFNSINISIVLYTMLYALGIFIQGPAQEYGLISSGYITGFDAIYFPIILLISGNVCGRLAKIKGFYNGAMVGIGSIIVGVVGINSCIRYCGSQRTTSNKYHWFVFSIAVSWYRRCSCWILAKKKISASGKCIKPFAPLTGMLLGFAPLAQTLRVEKWLSVVSFSICCWEFCK